MNRKIGILAIAAVLITAMAITPATAQDSVEVRSKVFQNTSSGNNGAVTADDWSVLYYDLDDGVNPERINWTFSSDDKIAENELIFKSTAGTVDYEFADFGNHSVIGVFGVPYVPVENDTDSNVKLLADVDSDQTLTTGEALELEDGYTLNIEQVDVDGNKVLWSLDKDGSEVDSGVVDLSDGHSASDENVTYKVDIGTHDDVEVIKVHVESAFRGETNAVIIDGYYQLSTEETQAEDFETGVWDDATGGSNEALKMDSDNDITLSSDKKITLHGDNYIQTAKDTSSNTRRYYLAKEETTGTVEIRSKVFQGTSSTTGSVNANTWAVLYYDLDDGVNPENISWTTDGNSKIAENNLNFTATAGEVDYEFANFGNHNVIGVFGESYVPVNNDTDSNVKLLADVDSDTTLTTGEALELEDGYTLNIEQVDVDGNKVLWSLDKDGSEVDSGVAEPDGSASKQNITYKVDIGTHDDVEVIKVHVESAFRGETNAVIIDGYYQLSTEETQAEDFETGVWDDASGGSDTPLTMDSDTDITLSSDKKITLHGDNYIQTAKDGTAGTRRYYFAKEVTLGEEPTTDPTATPEDGEATATATPTAEPAFEPDLERGAEIYAETCEACHAADGTGALPGQPDFTDPSFWEGENQEELFDAVYNGLGAMPAQSSTYSEDEVKSAIAHESMEFGGVAWSDIAETGATPTATPTDTAAPTDTATAEPTDTGEDEEPTPTGTSPGFTALFAVAGLLAVAYTVARRKH